ncbi:DUF2752 domain-containing protein [Sphingobacterium lactis]|uniref:DUF2752 domain-containing protein n=1 Tax=Sphingobacterium lactis TaxID=797291 RepID=UPI003F81318F
MIDKKNKLYRITGIVCFLGLLWLGLIHYSEADATVCPIKLATGYPCPSCGSSRSILAFLKGDFRDAIMINPLGIVSLIIIICIILLLLIDIVFKKDLYYRTYSYVEQFLKTNKLISILLILLILANWIWNIKKGL